MSNVVCLPQPKAAKRSLDLLILYALIHNPAGLTRPELEALLEATTDNIRLSMDRLVRYELAWPIGHRKLQLRGHKPIIFGFRGPK